MIIIGVGKSNYTRTPPFNLTIFFGLFGVYVNAKAMD
jgi:hypothetical protein